MIIYITPIYKILPNKTIDNKIETQVDRQIGHDINFNIKLIK